MCDRRAAPARDPRPKGVPMSAPTRRPSFRLLIASALAVPLALGAFVSPALAADTDGDGMPNLWEKNNGLKPLVKDHKLDPDADGLTNIQEYNKGTKPQVADTDGDRLTDGDEVNVHKTKPKKKDTDGDTLGDGDEVTIYMTSPTKADTDADGLDDDFEVLECNAPDDTTPDEELETCTDPNDPDTDGDGLGDGDEEYWSLDPNDPHSNGSDLTDGEADQDGDGEPNATDEVDDNDPCEVDPDSVECEESLEE